MRGSLIGIRPLSRHVFYSYNWVCIVINIIIVKLVNYMAWEHHMLHNCVEFNIKPILGWFGLYKQFWIILTVSTLCITVNMISASLKSWKEELLFVCMERITCCYWASKFLAESSTLIRLLASKHALTCLLRGFSIFWIKFNNLHQL